VHQSSELFIRRRVRKSSEYGAPGRKVAHQLRILLFCEPSAPDLVALRRAMAFADAAFRLDPNRKDCG
jgi:hypothetical protein